jgi:glycosyltransferase involved in cell wall biosynthesis
MSDLNLRKTPIISVVIPVFNDEGILLKCLNALREQTLPKDDFEVIVVDNGSRTNVASFLTNDYPEVRCINENTAGSYHARNAGVQASKGSYIAFTDADCVPSPQWLSEALREFQESADLAYLAGNILVFPRIPDKPNLAERFEMRNAFRQKYYLEAAHYGATANVIVAKFVVSDRVGWFNEAEGRGDDTSWGQAVWRAGLTQRFSESSIVNHPARNSLKELIRKAARDQGRYFFWECQNQPLRKRMSLLLRHTRRDVIVPRWKIRWWIGTGTRRTSEILQVMLVGYIIHYFALLEKFRITFGGQPLPR